MFRSRESVLAASKEETYTVKTIRYIALRFKRVERSSTVVANAKAQDSSVTEGKVISVFQSQMSESRGEITKSEQEFQEEGQ